MLTSWIAWLDATTNYDPRDVYFGTILLDLVGIIGTGIILI
jgi:hypothetical protein